MLVSESQRLGSAAVLTALLAVYGVSLLHARLQPRERPISWGSQGPSLMAVEVSGDREKDGIYFLPEGTTVEKALHLVGIPRENSPEDTDPGQISSGFKFTVSPQGALSLGEMAAARKLALGLPVDLKRILQEELTLVPGIGEKTADQIIQLKMEKGGFKDISDLRAVPGIQEKKLNRLKEYLVVRPVRGKI